MKKDKEKVHKTLKYCAEFNLKAGYIGKIFKAYNTRNYKKGPFKSLICAEFYLGDDKIFASHFGRGSSLGIAKYDSRLLKKMGK